MHRRGHADRELVVRATSGSDGYGRAGSDLAAREQMRPIFEKARAAGFQLGALLNSGCDIIEADDGIVVSASSFPFHAAKASEEANAGQPLEGVLERCWAAP